LPAVTVTVPVRGAVKVLCVAASLKPRVLPVKYTTLIHDGADTVNNVAFVVTVTFLCRLPPTPLPLPPSDGIFVQFVAGDIVSVGTNAACVTEIVRVGAPGAVTVMVPILWVVFGLGMTFILKEPLPVRFAGVISETVSHVGLLLVTVHCLLDVTVTETPLAPDVGLHALRDKVSVGTNAACVTEIVRVGAPGAVTVMVPTLWVVFGLGMTLILKEPLPVRFAGAISETVSHVGLLLVTVHCLLDVTVTETPLAPDVGLHVLRDKVSVGTNAACVTEIVRVGAPGAVTIMVPILWVVFGLGMTFILKEPLPVRFAGVISETVSHVGLLLVTVHCLLDVTVTATPLDPDVGLHVLLDKVSVGTNAACVTEIVRVGALGAVTVMVPIL